MDYIIIGKQRGNNFFMISLIILNWERVDNIISSVKKYSDYKLIDEIIVFNNNHKYRLNHIASDKVVVIESSRDLGLYTRFSAAGLARNNCIMYCDDDLFMPEKTIEKLYAQWLKLPNVCHGVNGRMVKDLYNMAGAFGEVPVILTRCMLVSKAICLAAFNFSLCFDDLVCEPKGNGEDIILSFVAISKSGQLNRSHKLPYIELPDNEDGTSVAISKRWKNHINHRTKVLVRCRDLLGLPI